jgi:hypothetical protein
VSFTAAVTGPSELRVEDAYRKEVGAGSTQTVAVAAQVRYGEAVETMGIVRANVSGAEATSTRTVMEVGGTVTRRVEYNTETGMEPGTGKGVTKLTE